MRSPEKIKATLENAKSGLQESLVRSLGTYTVALFAITGSGDAERLHFTGTGTLVTVGNCDCILTAAHVWHDGLKSSSHVGITLKEDVEHRCTIETRALIPFGPPIPQNWNEWGPDLVFLRIPMNHIGGIKAFKSFYPLDKARPKPELDGVEALLLMGAPGEFEKHTPTRSELNINGFFSDVNAQPYVRGDFDFVDLKEEVNLPGLPKDFGGVSGGGLWRVRVFESPETAKIDWLCFLEGVAFYQLKLADPHIIIRCHGEDTIRIAMKEVPTNLK